MDLLGIVMDFLSTTSTLLGICMLLYISESSSSYGMRMKFCVSALKVKSLLASIRSSPSKVDKLSQVVRFYHTKSILGFVKYRLQASNEACKTVFAMSRGDESLFLCEQGRCDNAFLLY